MKTTEKFNNGQPITQEQAEHLVQLAQDQYDGCTRDAIGATCRDEDGNTFVALVRPSDDGLVTLAMWHVRPDGSLDLMPTRGKRS